MFKKLIINKNQTHTHTKKTIYTNLKKNRKANASIEKKKPKVLEIQPKRKKTR